MLNGWKKGALHTHSFWSDGEAFPEQVVLRHLERGYDFVCLTDHNNLGLDPQHWLYVIQQEQGPFPEGLPYIGGCTWQTALERYQTDFPGIPETKTIAARKYVRVRSLPEVKEIFRELQNFAVIGGEELTTRLKTPNTRYQLDMGVLNLKQQMNYLSGDTLPETLRLNKELYDHLRSQQEQSSLFIVNHPGGYYYDLAPEALIVQDDIRHFELCNSNVDGAGGEGSFRHPRLYDNEKFWDIVNAHRAEDGKQLLLGAASDDAHFYTPERIDLRTGVGRAWVMVYCPGDFNENTVIDAMNRGDYYPTLGVLFESIVFENGTLRVRIKAEKDRKYTIRFVSTKHGFSRKIRTLDLTDDRPRSPRTVSLYSDEIGQAVFECSGTEAEYTMQPDDLYIRAAAVSDKPVRCRSSRHPAFETAWTQPYKIN